MASDALLSPSLPLDGLTPSRDVNLPRLVADLGEEDPRGVWVSVPRHTNLKEGWRDVTYGELANAVDGAASWIEREMVYEWGDVVAYIGSVQQAPSPSLD